MKDKSFQASIQVVLPVGNVSSRSTTPAKARQDLHLFCLGQVPGTYSVPTPPLRQLRCEAL